MSSASSSLYEKYNIDPKYNKTHTYGRSDSHYNKGNYPPDWSQRRKAVWGRQNYECGRCGINKRKTSQSEVHHIKHLDDGGSNRLDNLVGLCQHCHALMHPESSVVSGAYQHSNILPDMNADDRVAVIRRPDEDEAYSIDLDNLANESDPDVNELALTDYAVATSAEDAKRAGSDLRSLLKDYGYVPRKGNYHTLEVNSDLIGKRGTIIIFWSPDIEVKSDASVQEESPDMPDEAPSADYIFTNDGQSADVTITDGKGDTIKQTVEFGSIKSEHEISPQIEPPELSLRTAPRYVFETLFHLLILGIIPGTILTFFAPTVPGLGGLASWIVYSLLSGFVLTVLEIRSH